MGKSKTTSEKTEFTLTNNDMRIIDNCLAGLDGTPSVVYDDAGKPQRGPVIPYNFTNGFVYMNIMRNRAALAPHLDIFSKATANLLRAKAPKDAGSLDPIKYPKEFRDFIEESDKLADATASVSLWLISYGDLCIGNKDSKNMIPASVTAPLFRFGIITE